MSAMPPNRRRRALHRRTAVPEEVLPCEGGRCEERQRAQTKQPRCEAEDPQLDADRGPPAQDPGSMMTMMILDDDDDKRTSLVM